MTTLARRLTRKCAPLGVLVCSLAFLSPRVAAASDPSLDELNERALGDFERADAARTSGDEKKAASAFMKAADTWMQAADRIPESADTRGQRNNIVGKSLQASLFAFEQGQEQACEHVTRAAQSGRAYLKTLDEMYAGEARNLDEYSFIATKVVALENDAQSATCDGANRQVPKAESVQPFPSSEIEPPLRENQQDAGSGKQRTMRVAGIASMAAGSALLVTGLSLYGVFAVRGSSLSNDLNTLYEMNASEAELNVVRENGRKANAAAGVSGWVVAPIGGIVLVTGIVLFTQSKRANGGLISADFGRLKLGVDVLLDGVVVRGRF